MQHLSIDIETYSSVNLKKSGMHKYVQSADFEILLLAYSVDGAPPEVLDFRGAGALLPLWLAKALESPAVIKHAYNAAFEWYSLCKLLGRNPLREGADDLSQWRCTMVHGLYCGYTKGLGVTGAALGISEEKQKQSAGKALLRYFCRPCKATKANEGRTRNLPKDAPEKWRQFIEYNRQDVTAEMEILRRLSVFPLPATVQAQWVQDQRMNARGVALDLDLMRGAMDCAARVAATLLEEAKRLTALDNPNSPAQLLSWLRQHGASLDNLQKEAILDALAHDALPEEARRVLQLRRGLSKTSVRKYASMEAVVCEDSRARGLLQFYGANRTGRWSGRLIQVQNLPRTYLASSLLAPTRQWVKERNTEALQALFGDVPDTLSQLIRTAFIPARGHLFVDADFSAIEARVIAWLSEEEWRLAVFRTHGKIYEASAATMFGVRMDTIVKGHENYHLRARGKVAELALGYQGGVGALLAMDTGHDLNADELPEIVQRWRQNSPRIVRLWRAVDTAAKTTIQTARETHAGRCVFRLEGDMATNQVFLTVELPSARKLFYVRPEIVSNRFGGEGIQYWGANQSTGKWEAMETYGGKLVENITQAVARDCLSMAIDRLESAEYPIVFHIHDEVVIDIEQSRANLAEVVAIMSQAITWAPGLPLAADGWTGEFFRKD